MELNNLFADHIAHVTKIYENAFAALEKEKDVPQVDAILIHSGSEGVYFADDMHVPFKSFAHFNHWVPVINRPDQMLLYQPNKKPIYFQVVPPDFWYEQTVVTEDWWAGQFEIIRLEDAAEVMDHLPETRRIAFMGENEAFASEMGMPSTLINEQHLTNYLDFYRAMKTEYEVEQVREANRMAIEGHKAAEEAFRNGGSEWDIHLAFLNANQMIEHDSPYTNIVGLDEKSAILHYQGKRRSSGKGAKVLLIDAGCRVRGYCSDITRTYASDDAHPVFKSLIKAMDKLELDLVAMSKVGISYAEIHYSAHAGILDILLDHELISGAREDLVRHKISNIFFPHGIGHLLGLNVHDVGGFFSDDKGKLAPAPDDHPFLRLNRTMEAGMVYTIEPGLYFIPVLLDKVRGTEKGKHLNWELIDALIPYGGIRIEDNILVTENGPVNLTR